MESAKKANEEFKAQATEILTSVVESEKDLQKVERSLEELINRVLNGRGMVDQETVQQLHLDEQKIQKEITEKRNKLLFLRQSMRNRIFETQKEIIASVVESQSEIPKDLRRTLTTTWGVQASLFDWPEEVEILGKIKQNAKLELNPEDLEVVEQNGIKGSFGTVYKGKYQQLPVAVKKLNKQDIDEATLKEFHHEIQTMASLHHVNILMLIGAITTPGKLAIVTEYMENGSVADQISKGDLKPRRRMMIAKGIAQGMNWLHQLNPPIVHFDLKPQNILLDEYWRVKISDFGMAQIKEHKGMAGTPLYMSPEMLEGKPCSTKSDIFSFSIVLWELYHSPTKKLYDEKYKTFEDLKKAIGEKQIRPDLDGTSYQLKKLLQQCFFPDPEQRPTFKDMLNQHVFDKILLETTISDANKNGREFWAKELRQAYTVPWVEFQQAMVRSWNAPQPEVHGEDKIRFECLKILLGATADGRVQAEAVKLESFAAILEWFGPVKDGGDLLNRVYDLSQKPWFHGGIGARKAEALLTKKSVKEGTYLVRFSDTVPGHFTLSYRPKTPLFGNKKVQPSHFRISHVAGQDFVFAGQKFSSLEDVVANISRFSNIKLLYPATGSDLENLIQVHKRIQLGELKDILNYLGPDDS